LTEYWGDDHFHPIRDFKKIAWRYLRGWFLFDILAVLPFANMVRAKYQESDKIQLLYLLKLLRL
jgi:hypothetical protein